MRFILPILTVVYSCIALVFGLASVALLVLAAVELWEAVRSSGATSLSSRVTMAVKEPDAWFGGSSLSMSQTAVSP